MKMLKRTLALMLALIMMFSAVPFNAYATESTDQPSVPTEAPVDAPETEEPAAEEPVVEDEVVEEPVVEEPAEEEEVVEAPQSRAVPASNTVAYKYNVVHLDAGRKYFSVDEIKTIIDNIEAAGFNQLNLYLSDNQGFRFALDNMTITTSNGTYNLTPALGDGYSDSDKAPDYTGKYLTQSEMDTIITYAHSKGIDIVPAINVPGHMGAILEEFPSFCYKKNNSTSKSSIDLANDEAVAFALALTEKYAAYFASKGCKYYCVGADEYANDLSSMGFEGMGSTLYTKFVQFLNDAADIVIAKGMTPRAFNDGFYYKDYKINIEPNKAYEVYYWSSGWSGYDVAAASTIANKGHKMINTHGDYYWVLGKSNWQCSASKASGFSTTVFQGSTISDPAGSMFCIWCDKGNADSAANVISKTASVIAAFGDALPAVEDLVSGVVTPDPEPEEPETVTKTDKATKVEITAPGLTGLTVTVVDEVPTIEGAAEGKVLAWDMTPATADGAYEGEATVAVPVPEGWDSSKMGAFVIEADNSVKLIDGAVNADGNFEFTMPHFSVGGTYEVAPIAATPENITLEIGGTQEYTLDGLVGTEGTYTTTNGVASYTIVHHTETTPAGTTVSEVSSVAAGNYILGNGTNSWITLNNDSVGTTSDPANATLFTIAASGKNWTIKSGNYYLTITGEWYEGRNLTATTTSASWSYSAGFYQKKSSFMGSSNIYLKADASVTSSDTDAAKLYTRTTGTGSTTNTTTITFTALAGGTDSVEIGSTTYNITVNRKTVTDTVTVNANKTYADNSTAIVSNTDASVATATLNNGTLTITGVKVGTTTVTTDNAVYNITVVTEDLSKVDPIVVQTWITNRPLQTSGTLTGTHTNNENDSREHYYKNIPATTDGIATEAGLPITELVDQTYVGGNITYVYWRARYLNETIQDTSRGNNQTQKGDSLTHIRYWNSTWQYKNDAGTWLPAGDVNSSGLPQIVAYYLQKSEVTDEVDTLMVDFGEPYGNSYNDSNYVLMDFAVKYESGERVPNAFPVNNKTQKFHCDTSSTNDKAAGNIAQDKNGNYYRNLWAVSAQATDEYEVYMVTMTATSDSVNVRLSSGADSEATGQSDFYAGKERVVWVNDEANLGDFADAAKEDSDLRYTSISGDVKYTVGGEPYIPEVEIYNRHGMLITYYVRAKATEDALTVHYVDDTEKLEFYHYNIAVKEGTTFKSGIALNTANPNGELQNGTVTNYHGKTQTVSADLKTLSQVGAQYRYTEYNCVRVKRSADGKDVYLYYTFDSTVSFVADFGLPMEITAAKLSDELNGVEIEDMLFTGVANTKFGKLTDNGTTVTYTPNKILTGLDYFTLIVKTKTDVGGILDEAANQIAFRVYVTPATTVYYEEGFLLNNASGWETTAAKADIPNQSTVVLGKTGTNNYGYDGAYASKGTDTGYITGGAGASTSFTFTGTGFQLYGNSNSASGVVTVYSLGNLNKLYMIDTKLSAGTSGATNQQSGGTYYSLPFISETDLPYGTYTVQIKQTNNQGSIYLDGVRILNTINDQTKGEANIYYDDKEDKPAFYEVRDFVLNAIDVEKLEDSQYTDPADRVGLVDKVSEMAGQVYNALGDSEKAVVINKNGTTFTAGQAQDLLDNGPKNELYLYPGQTLAFSVTTDRVVQLGLKAPTGSSKFTLTVDNKVLDLNSLSTTVDMFYKIAEKGGTTHTVSITVTDGVLSTTLLKVCDDPNFTFNALTQEDIENTLLDIYGLTDVDTPVEPEVPETPVEPEAPEETTKPTEPEVEETKPTKPNKPSKPEKPGKPENTKPTEPQKPGKPGNNGNQKPGKEEKTYTLKITFVNLFGKKVGTATITTTSGVVSASQIAGKAPARYKALWFIPVTLRANGNTSIVVPVL